ncbi:MAG: FAD-dependent oxidoreductase [Rhizomicrobium sp.]
MNRLSDEVFDLLVIGGGITGAAIARDASLRGLSVALIERHDFAHATSAHNSRLIHGGLRYLRNFELGLVRESLRERRIWLRVAPHLVRPLPFLLPLPASSFARRAMLSAGLALYDLLAFDSGWLADPDQRLHSHTWLNARAARALEPCLESLPIAGAFGYFDAQMYSPERLALECVLDAAKNGAVPANHLEAGQLLLRNDRVEGTRVLDTVTKSAFDVRASLTIVAAGPWADVFLGGALGRPVRMLRLSKGIHLIVPTLTRGHALTMAANGGHFFVLPWRNCTLLGTTDTAFDGSPDNVPVSEAEIEKFLRLVNAHLPSARLMRDDVRYFYAGLRPLVDEGARSTYAASRRAELIDHGKENGVGALLSVMGGKWTTSRALAQKTVDRALQVLGKRGRTCATAARRLPGGAIDRVSCFMSEAKAKAGTLPNPDHLARLYGSRLPQLLAFPGERPDLCQPLSASGDIGAQILLAIRQEMALTLEDVVMRRTGIGQEGHPGVDALGKAATIMAAECGWSETRRRAEIESVAANFRDRRSPA